MARDVVEIITVKSYRSPAQLIKSKLYRIGYFNNARVINPDMKSGRCFFDRKIVRANTNVSVSRDSAPINVLSDSRDLS